MPKSTFGRKIKQYMKSHPHATLPQAARALKKSK